ncbi:accessory gene regulator B family protein [Clostridium sp. SHJSY1]|uniref:accessory gene regulator B family protein n=1 Tax=Clostridium sp. SHJSY1 TaxID=2942483 RepID=UPI002876D53C|nr:accessory gene regulator B family protein [Clostridium sp. SHJSY1]MDS0527510.1 accessory gene regulator B family protein [Clostridium sp. SHJSY1]
MKELINEKTIPELICKKILKIVGQTKVISDLEKKKLSYYICALYVNTTKIMILLAIALILKVFWEVIIMWCFFALIRRTAFGIHSSSSFNCTIVTVLIFAGGGLISKYVNFPIHIYFILNFISFVVYVIYAPADTESRPLVGKKMRKKFKNKTILTFIVLFLLVTILNIYQIKILFAISAFAEAISILPITYRIFKRRYKNYEYFKENRK